MNTRNRAIFDAARQYLLEFDGVTNRIIDDHLSWKKTSINDLSDLFRLMIDHAKNRQGMPNAIGNVDLLRKVLFNFNHSRVLEKYQTNWGDLFDEIKRSVNVPARMVKSNTHNYWVIYCKSILSIALFVNRFDSINAFRTYVDQFIKSDTPDTRLALPLLLQEEIFGYRFALACDFLKENIDPHFVKPDVHIKEIFTGLKLSEKGASDFQIFRDVILFSESISELPYAVDKLLWLIGSGNFYKANIRINPSKPHFI